jgi:Flp pilus assembly protein TadD
LTQIFLYAKLKAMRYLLIFSLLLIPSFSYAQYSQEPDVGAYPNRGKVITRSNTEVTSGSYQAPRGYKSQYLKKTSAKQKRSAAKPGKRLAAAPDEKDKATQGVKDILKEEAKSYHEQGYKLQTNGDYKGALTYYQKAADLDPYSPMILNDLGVAYEAVGDEINAVNMYRKAADRDPNYLASYTNLALFYEEKGDSRNASYYWQKRYELGKAGEYWREQAAVHLMRLGTYPEIKKDILEKEAAVLSRELSQQRLAKKRNDAEDAKLHYYIGQRLVMKGDHLGAIKEFETALALNPADADLKEKIMDAYKKTEKSYSKEKVLSDTQDALNYIKSEDFNSAETKLRSALSAAYRAAQEKR